MSHSTPATKSPKSPKHETATAPAAGPHGIALMPPNYGVGFVDRAAAEDGPIQLMPPGRCPLFPSSDHAVIQRQAPLVPPNRTGLPDQVKAGIESISGFDMSDVRVHYNSSKPAQLQAFAYTQGSDIHVSPGQERHLPHEAWHVVQQKQGRVQPTMQMKGSVPVNDDQRLEQEADVMGVRALAPIAQVHDGREVKCLGTAKGDTLWEDEDAQSAEPIQQRVLSGVPAVQMKYELCAETDVQRISDHRAKTVRAVNIRGETLGPAANSPSVEPFGWTELKTAGHTLANTSGYNSHYNAVRAHLMNGRLGGPGDEKWNLAPAPAQVNSLMSAGPETAAKNLVDAGHIIWIETTVSYHGNSTTAIDLTSVVPKHILMKWGTMDGKVPEQTWNTPIDLPVPPLQGHEAQEYRDWDNAKPADLVFKLSTQSNQVRAQAFDLVSHGNLKFEIIKAYPSVYLSMTRLTKGQVLSSLGATQRTEFLTVLGVVTSPDRLVEEAILPLAVAGYPLEAQGLFAGCSEPEQRAMLISWKGELLDHLGAIGNTWSKRDYTIFNYNVKSSQAEIIGSMSKPELTAFLSNRTGRERIQILDNWAEYTNGRIMTDSEKNTWVDGSTTINDEYKVEYANAIGARNRSAEYRANRPSRRR